MESLTPVTLVVKAPNQKIADQTIECALDWTVKKLKEHLSYVYPSKPRETQQRIIYSGQLLQDHLTLKDVLRQYEPNQQTHTVHLVCSPSTTDFSQQQLQSPQSTPNNLSSDVAAMAAVPDGLRHRYNAAASSSSMTPEQPATPTLPPSSSSSSGVVPPACGAFSVPVANPMLVHGAAGFNQPMMAVPGGAAFHPMMAYNAEQMLWLQQYYTQYMAQYMQYQQQGMQRPAVPEGGAPAVTPPPAAARVEPAAARQQQRRPEVVRMNAQGGPVVDDDDDEMPNRDWLDSVYTLIRFAVLLCILYFYSTVGRFVATMALIFVLYLYQVGWFRVHRRNERLRQPPQPAAPPAAEEPLPGAADDNAGTDPEPNNAETVAEADPAVVAAPGGLSLVWTFFITFFSSLAPQQPPPPVNVN